MTFMMLTLCRPRLTCVCVLVLKTKNKHRGKLRDIKKENSFVQLYNIPVFQAKCYYKAVKRLKLEVYEVKMLRQPTLLLKKEPFFFDDVV